MTSDLETMLKEARYMNRTAVINPMPLHEMHNFGKQAEGSVKEYYDLPNSHLITEQGKQEKLNYILTEDFFKMRRGYQSVYFLSPSVPFNLKKIAQKTVVVRYMHYMAPHGIEQFFGENYLRYIYNKTHVHLEPAKLIKRLAKQVVAKLGKYYVLRCRVAWEDHIPYSAERANDYILKKNPRVHPVLKHYLTAEGLCRQMQKIFPPGSNLYIESNLWKPYDEDYFGQLRNIYNVYRCYDFPELNALATGEKPNTAKLFLIEQILKKNSTDSIILDFRRPGETSPRILKTLGERKTYPPHYY